MAAPKYRVEVFSTGDVHTASTIPELIKILNPYKQGKLNFGRKRIATLLKGTGVYKNTLRLTRIDHKGVRKDAVPAGGAVSIDEPRPLQIKTRRARRKKKQNITQATRSEEYPVVDVEPGSMPPIKPVNKPIVPAKETPQHKARNRPKAMKYRMLRGRLSKQLRAVYQFSKTPKQFDPKKDKNVLQRLIKSIEKLTDLQLQGVLLQAARDERVGTKDIVDRIVKHLGGDSPSGPKPEPKDEDDDDGDSPMDDQGAVVKEEMEPEAEEEQEEEETKETEEDEAMEEPYEFPEAAAQYTLLTEQIQELNTQLLNSQAEQSEQKEAARAKIQELKEEKAALVANADELKEQMEALQMQLQLAKISKGSVEKQAQAIVEASESRQASLQSEIERLRQESGVLSSTIQQQAAENAANMTELGNQNRDLKAELQAAQGQAAANQGQLMMRLMKAQGEIERMAQKSKKTEAQLLNQIDELNEKAQSLETQARDAEVAASLAQRTTQSTRREKADVLTSLSDAQAQRDRLENELRRERENQSRQPVAVNNEREQMLERELARANARSEEQSRLIRQLEQAQMETRQASVAPQPSQPLQPEVVGDTPPLSRRRPEPVQQPISQDSPVNVLLPVEGPIRNAIQAGAQAVRSVGRSVTDFLRSQTTGQAAQALASAQPLQEPQEQIPDPIDPVPEVPSDPPASVQIGSTPASTNQGTTTIEDTREFESTVAPGERERDRGPRSQAQSVSTVNPRRSSRSTRFRGSTVGQSLASRRERRREVYPTPYSTSRLTSSSTRGSISSPTIGAEETQAPENTVEAAPVQAQEEETKQPEPKRQRVEPEAAFSDEEEVEAEEQSSQVQQPATTSPALVAEAQPAAQPAAKGGPDDDSDPDNPFDEIRDDAPRLVDLVGRMIGQRGRRSRRDRVPREADTLSPSEIKEGIDDIVQSVASTLRSRVARFAYPNYQRDPDEVKATRDPEAIQAAQALRSALPSMDVQRTIAGYAADPVALDVIQRDAQNITLNILTGQRNIFARTSFSNRARNDMRNRTIRVEIVNNLQRLFQNPNQEDLDLVMGQIFQSAPLTNLQNPQSAYYQSLTGSGPEEDDLTMSVSAPPTEEVKDSPSLGPVGLQPSPPSTYNLNAIALTKLGRNSLEDYQQTMELLKSPDLGLAQFLQPLRLFIEKSFLTPSHGNRMKDLLTELFHQHKDKPGMYAKYIVHLFLYVIDLKMGAEPNQVAEAEVHLKRHFQNYFGETVSIASDQGFMAHVRLLMNLASKERNAVEPLQDKPYIEGSGQLDSLEEGLATLIRTTDQQQKEYTVLSRRRMHRTNHRGHTLFTAGASNRKTQDRFSPFKAQLDPDLRRPVTDFKSPRVITTQTPRIKTVKPSGAIGVSIPQIKPGELKYKTTYDREGRVTAVNVPFMQIPNTSGSLQRKTMTGSGVSLAHKTAGRRRGITLFGDDSNERRAQKRLRTSFTLSLYDEK